MIDPEVFAREILFLEEWTKQQLTSEVRLRYAQFLNKHLTTEEFREASRLIFEQNRSFPFPSVNDFIEKVRQSVEIRAQHEWNKIITYRFDIYGENPNPDGLTEIGHEALRTVKGLRHVHTSPVDQLTHLRTAFVQAYKAISTRPDEYDLQLPPQPSLPRAEEPVYLNPHQSITDEQQSLTIGMIQMLRQRIQSQVDAPIEPN